MSYRLFSQKLVFNMRTKTAVLFAAGLLGIVLSSLFITRYFFLYSLDDLERTQIERASTQASAVIKTLIHQQEERSYDWAYWDETYQFLIEGDDQYKRRNLYPEALDTLGLDMMAFITLDYQIQASLGRGYLAGESSRLSKQILSEQGFKASLEVMETHVDSNKTSISGLMKVNAEIWTVSITPIRDSEGNAAMVGWLIWGQHLTHRFPLDYSSILSSENKILLLDEAKGSEFKGLDNQWLSKITIKNEQEMSLNILLRDVDNRAIGYLQTSEPRSFYQKGHQLFFYLTLAILAAAILVSIFTLWLFRDKVSKRFSHFENIISNVIEIDDSSVVDNKKNRDEFDRITHLVQSMAESSTRAENQLNDTLQKYQALYQSQSIGMILVVDRIIVEVNDNFLSMLGYKRGDLIGVPLERLCADDDKACHINQMYEAITDTPLRFDATMLNYAQARIPCQVEVSLITQQGQTALMFSIKDISEQVKQQALIKNLTHFDSTSGLLNRPTMFQSLNDIWNESQDERQPSFSLIYIVTTRLSEIGEVYGDGIYDQVIRYIAGKIKNLTTAEHIGRISEKEFVLLISGVDSTDNVHVGANQLFDDLREVASIDGIELELGVKMALLPDYNKFESADAAIKSAAFTVENQTHGRHNIQVVDLELAGQARDYLIINRDLSNAIKNHELTAYFQPIVQASTGEVTGFEALARWQHPILGNISPAIFIPMAEERKLIIELGEQILELACQFISQVNQHRNTNNQEQLSIHVNLSGPHFLHSDLPDSIVQCLARHQLKPGQLVLELTESMLMGPEKQTIEHMEMLKQLGVQIALDDFGTGYSSFSTLCDFPLDIVKLDRSYIAQLEHNEKAKTVVRSVVMMAKELGLTTVAEGVETASLLRKLKIWDVDEIQGFYFFRPLDKETAIAMFSQSKT